jgi:hypothetical protein
MRATITNPEKHPSSDIATTESKRLNPRFRPNWLHYFESEILRPKPAIKPVWYTVVSWPHEQHPPQSGIITTIAPQLRAGCWPDLISDSNERTPAATLAGFFLAHAFLVSATRRSGGNKNK